MASKGTQKSPRRLSIVDHISNANVRPFIEVAEGKAYEVDTSYVAALRLKELSTDDDENKDFFHEAFVILLGDKATKEIEKMNLSIEATKLLFKGVSSLINGEDFEVEETERFQKD